MPRNYDIAELRRLDIAHHLPAQADWQEIEDLGGSRIITHADGCYIHDGDGNRILDGMAGLWCVNVGYGRDELAEVAKEQMLELPYYNSFFKTANPPAVMLADKIASLTGGRLPHVFFNSSGSEANDTILRLVRHYWQVKGEHSRTVFISRHNAYHGSTVAGVSDGRDEGDARPGLPCPRRPADGRDRACSPTLSVQRRPRHERRRISARPVRKPSKTKSSKSAPKMSQPLSASLFKAQAA